MTTVQVGTQVSGTILELHADFNSLVKKGQVLARLDPSLFQTQIEQASANLIRAQADLERLRVTLDDARTKLARAKELAGRQLIPQNELDTADVNVRSAEAQMRSSQAQVTQAQASLNQNQVNLDHTVILAPIDGLVISRNVDIGQTVAASMQAPTLFVLAADLTKMQVLANLDESDVGRIRPRQTVRFRVDAYPTDDFIGTVSQVRLQPIIQQNVVTYATVIDVPNPELKLKPGMTANVNIEIARASNVVRVPNAALRFRPTNDIYAALKQTPPEAPGRERGAGAVAARRGEAAGLRRRRPPRPAPRRRPPAPSAGGQAPTASGSRRPVEEGGAQALVAERGRGRGAAGGSGGACAADGADAGPASRAARADDAAPARPRRQRRALPRTRAPDRVEAPSPGTARVEEPRRRPPLTRCLDPSPGQETVGRVWIYANNQLQPVRVRLGITDGQATELLEGDLEPGAEVVTNVTTGNETRPAAAQGGFPFMGGPPGAAARRLRRPGGGGNRGGGGRDDRASERKVRLEGRPHVAGDDVSDRLQGARPQQDAHGPDDARHDHRRVGGHHARRHGQRRHIGDRRPDQRRRHQHDHRQRRQLHAWAARVRAPGPRRR